MRPLLAPLTALVIAAAAAAPSANAAGTWTKAPSNPTTGGQAFGLWLMTDGTILSHGSALNHWVILTPDKKGSYANGTWKSVASSAYSRGGAVEHVLKDGRFLEAGGEYIYVYPGCSANCAQPGNGSPLFKNTEIFDPVANTWTVQSPALYEIADTGTATLADGRVFSSSRTSASCQIFDPAMNMWTQAASIPLGNGDENSWASLQNGGVLAVGYDTAGAAIYDPATNKWQKTGPVPSGFKTGDACGISQMFDGRVLVYGLGTTYIYTPGPTAADTGTWVLGPKTLMGYEAEDEYSDTLPNGKVWAGLVAKTYGPGLILQEFDPDTNTVKSVDPPPDMGNPYPIDYVNLPNGQVMITAAVNDWIYTPDTPPKDEWRPTVNSVTFDSGSTYTLTGTQISGLINGADEGDDMTMAENYPIVWLTDEAQNVYYCRSFEFSNMMPSKGNAPETCKFTTPAGLPDGTYSLFVSAVGVQSKDPYPFTVGVGGMPRGTGGAGNASGGSAGASASGGSTATGGAAASGGAVGTASGGTTGSAGTATGTGNASTVGAGGTSGGAVGGTPTTPGGSSQGGSAVNSAAGGAGASASESSGCGCRTGAAPVESGRGALAMLGLALFAARRRRLRRSGD